MVAAAALVEVQAAAEAEVHLLSCFIVRHGHTQRQKDAPEEATRVVPGLKFKESSDLTSHNE